MPHSPLHRIALFLFAALPLLTAPADAQTYPESLSEAEVAYARAAIDSLRQNPRGPYERLRWYCRDGTVHPPKGTPCRTRGGGNQYAEWSETANRLADMGLAVGTILQGTGFEAFVDAQQVHDRLKQYLLEAYLVSTQDGWVLRRARTYRGARQAEDEEARGTQFLIRLLSEPGWTSEHYWLASQLVAVVPHVGVAGPESHFRIRSLATEIADLEPSFQPIRVRIHSFPSRSDAEAVRQFLERTDLDPAVRASAVALLSALEQHYDRRVQAATLASYVRRLPEASELRSRLDTLRTRFLDGEPRETLRRITDLTEHIRELVVSGPDGTRNLLLMDLQQDLQDQGATLATELAAAPAVSSRAERLRGLRPGVRLAYSTGLLSARERDALLARIRSLTATDTVTAQRYHEGIGYLARALDWATAEVESVMYPALGRFTRVEPAAAGYLDASVRATALLGVGATLSDLATDADSLLGTSHVVLGGRPGPGVRGLNPGVAVGPLRVVDAPQATRLDASAIYVMPETITELPPVAGILTRDAGNLLSHVQLLARNLGIPNATIPDPLLPTLRDADGRTVFFAVTPRGRVILEDTARITGAERSLMDGRSDAEVVRHRLDTSRLRLEVTAPVNIQKLRASDAGVIVGPKAAFVGELASTFERGVAEGVALPFGLFRLHVSRPMPSSDRTVFEELARTRERAAEMRKAGRSDEEVDAFVFEVLEDVRNAIRDLPWRPDVRDAITDAVQTTFGGELSPGVFVRSDTNVEDLPQFSGAGLNLTVPDRRSLESILAAVKEVWTSPFTERAYLWRRRILENWGDVYPSVLLQRSVPSEKSGVVVTTGLQYGDEKALTVSTGEGVGGAVDGERAETIVVADDGSVTLLSQARSPTRRILNPEAEGTRTVPARRPNYLLESGEIAELARAVRAWESAARKAGRSDTWDLEFGFTDGKLWLFQARPFVRYRNDEARRRLEVLDRETRPDVAQLVPMGKRP